MPFANKLRYLRKKHKWTQDELAQKVGVHGRHIGKYENAQVMPNADTLIRFAKVFDTSIDYLLLDSDDPTLVDLGDKKLLRQFKELTKMNEKDREVVQLLIDAFLKKKKFEALMVE